MNTYQLHLYNDLLSLVESNEAFYFQDFVLDGRAYRIFNYRLASYSNFQLPGAMECRGVMFELHSGLNKGDFRLASLPMEKFFNLNENPSTIGLDLSTAVDIQEKADGSLMSTYMHDGQLRLKSKGSLFSDQALAAMKHLAKDQALTRALKELADDGMTVNLEWCSPEHRIVLGYMEPTLKVLNVRMNDTGRYYRGWRESLLGYYAVEQVKVADSVAFVASIPTMLNIEGYVVQLASGQRIKIKTEWYLALHHAKDSVNNPRRLFECILSEGIDDVRAMFFEDPLAIKMIDEMQVKVDHLYNEMVKTVESYYESNKHLSRKDYAIKGQQELVHMHFGLAMNRYVGKVMDYKGFLKSRWKELGLKDTSTEKTDE